MTPLEASRAIVEFVVWEMRTADLPEHVRDATHVVRDGYPRPEALKRGHHKQTGPLIVSGFPRDEEKVIDRRDVFPHQAPDVVREFLETGEMGYVLVTDTSG